jgi:parallel beta-helix repeat protein
LWGREVIIIVDGNGHRLQGPNYGRWFDVTDVDNVTIKNTKIRDFNCGVFLDDTSDNTIYHNSFVNNTEQVHDYSWD